MSSRRIASRRFVTLAFSFAAALAAPSLARSQSIPGAVLAQREPHHHLVYEDSTIRVLRVRVPRTTRRCCTSTIPTTSGSRWGRAPSSTFGAGVPDATVTSPDLAVHYSFGKFAHIARNPGAAPFDNITVELLEPQTGVRNLCEAAVADKPLDCHESSTGRKARFSGGTEHPALATDQITVSLLAIEPGATLRPAAGSKTTWVIALDSSDTRQKLVVGGGPKWVGGTFRATNARPWALSNMSDGLIRVISVVRN